MPESKTYAELLVGDSAEFYITITDMLIDEFASLSGNTNPMHADVAYEGAPFGKRFAHGMLAGALFSRLIGMQLPGLHSMCLSQSLLFKKPLFAGDTTLVRGTIMHKSDATRTISLSMQLLKGDVVLVESEATVKVLA